MAKKILDEYLVRLRGTRYNKVQQKNEKNKVVRILFWGDEVDIVDETQNTDQTQGRIDVSFYNYSLGVIDDGYIKKKKKSGQFVPLKFRDENLLRVLFVDVQQGDATIVELPSGEKILIDGGEGKFIARILAALFPGSSQVNPVIFDSIVVTHGDADHFSGLFEIPKTETHRTPRKRIFLKTRHIYHNGLVKSGNSKTKQAFGQSVEANGNLYVAELWDDTRDAPVKSKTFRDWDTVIGQLLNPGGQIKRLHFGDDAEFDRLKSDGLSINVLGPGVETVNGKEMLRYFKSERGSKSASHTVNGHSVILRLTYKHVNFFFGGDLNIDASEFLMDYYAHQDAPVNIRSEILKVPHHGSHEYDPHFLGTVNPAVSVISSGDETPRKDYVHPRANLLGALGRASRGDMPLIFCTELAAFFAYMGVVIAPLDVIRNNGDIDRLDDGFPAFNRLVYGAVRVRTNGKKVLVAVESSSAVKEYYLFEVDATGNIRFLDKPSII